MTMKSVIAICVFATLLLVATKPVCAGTQEISIAAASDLNFVLPELATRFEKETGNKVKSSFGSSGNFFAQIQNGAPYDVFMSADIEYPQRLEQAGLAEQGTLYGYATGKLVLWAPVGSRVDIRRGPQVLLDADVKKIAIANPAHAPYGRAAMAALKSERIYDQVASKLVYGENISQTAQFVFTGNADVGIIALSLALAPAMKDKGTFYLVPQKDYPPLEQAAVVLRSSESPRKAVARQFLEFLRKPESVATMKNYGFSLGETRAEKLHSKSK